MASIDIDIYMIASTIFEGVYAAQYELAAALIFVIGVRLGKLGYGFEKVFGGRKAGQKKGKQLPHPQYDNRSRQSKAQSPEKKVARFDGNVDTVDPALLKDATWLIPQITQLCRSQVPQALQLYRAAVRAGLKVAELNADECDQLFVSLVTATIRAGQNAEVEKLFEDLQRCGVDVSSSLFGSAVKLCTSKQMFSEALTIFQLVSKDPAFILKDKSIWSCLLFCATEAKAYQMCTMFFEHVKEIGTPSPKDFGNLIRLAAINGDCSTSLAIIQEMHDCNVEVDHVQYNTALGTCVSHGKLEEACKVLVTMEKTDGVADVITYNTMMKGYAKAGQVDKCFELFDRLRTKGLTPSQVSYGILLDCCINENQVERAAEVFNNMTKGGCKLNTVLYTMLIKGFTRAGDCQQAMDVYKQMKTDTDISPDLITFSILIKANCDNDRFEEALDLLAEMVTFGLKPDEVVFNNLIAGCARRPNAKLGRQLYDDMVASGVRPSNATFSILIRLLHQCKLLEDAVLLLKTEPAKHKVEPEVRLYLQLMQCCIRERQGRRSIEVYELLAERSTPTAAMHNSILTTCTKLNMLDTAVEIVGIAVAHGARIDARDTHMLAECASKKGKYQLVQSCVASMKALRHTVDPKFLA